MMFRMLILMMVALSLSVSHAGDPRKPYNPDADARAELNAAIKEAAKDGKHVLVQVGGNWCSWCLKLEKLYHSDKAVSEALENNFVLVHLNYSDENKNEAILAELGYPQRFGFPVLVVLDGKGKRLHTQNSGYLEKDKGHDPKKVIGFLEHWAPKALDPASYEG